MPIILDRRTEGRSKEDIASNVFSYLIEARHDFYKEINLLQSLRFKLFYIYLLMFSCMFYVFNHFSDQNWQYCFGGIAAFILYVTSLLFAIKTNRYTIIIKSDRKNIDVIHHYINDYIQNNSSEKLIKFHKVNKQDELFTDNLNIRGQPVSIYIFPLISVSSIFIYSFSAFSVFPAFQEMSVFEHFVFSSFISFVFLSLFHILFHRPEATPILPKSIGKMGTSSNEKRESLNI